MTTTTMPTPSADPAAPESPSEIATIHVHGYAGAEQTTVILALEERCPCGTGSVANPAWLDWMQAGQPVGKEPRDYPAGPGRPAGPLQPEQVTCPDCEGRRVRPTAAGRAILRFMDRWQ